MFKKKCKRCGRKVNKDFEFCPYCGYNIKREQNEKDFGLLGKDDGLNLPDMMKMPFGFNRLFSTLIKQLDKQFKELDREIGKDTEKMKKEKMKIPKFSRGISVSISTATGKKPEIRVKGFGPGFENLKKEIIEPEKKPIKIKLPKQEISEEKARKLAKLPKAEAETQVRRLANKIIYEITLPGVKKLKDVIINQLENSIEIKAFSKDKVYFKLLPINLPILNYELTKEKLILELKAK